MILLAALESGLRPEIPHILTFTIKIYSNKRPQLLQI